MPKFNVSQAAKTFGKDWKTIDSYLKKGKLSYDKNNQGHREIDLTELIRVFGEPQGYSIPKSIGNNQEIPDAQTKIRSAFDEAQTITLACVEIECDLMSQRKSSSFI